MNITATDSAVETVCQALLAYSSQFADALQRVKDPAARAVTPFAGVKVPLSAMLSVELSELLVHGFDVTRAAGLPGADGWRTGRVA